MNSSIKKDKGFTIIEVVLVLAIAGLIFLVVFLALPQLQRSQRDNQRRSDISRFTAAIQSYQSNNNGKVPTANQTALNTFVTNYLRGAGQTFADPNGSDYIVTLSTSATYTTEVPANTIYFYSAAGCDGESAVARTGNTKVAMRVDLEAGGAICQQN